MYDRTYYRTVWISDAHLGFKGAKADALLSFLRSISCGTLYLVGDILELWGMKGWNEHCTAVLREIVNLYKSGTRIVYIPGNHDAAIRQSLPVNFGLDVEVTDETIHTTTSGERYVILHGDQFDPIIGHHLQVLGSFIYDRLLSLNGVLHNVRKLMGYKSYWSLSACLKQKAKRAMSYINDFETAAMHHALNKRCDGVICGHIHKAKIADSVVRQYNVRYCNCGDWVESLTALVENPLGGIELVEWHDLRRVSSKAA